MRKITNPFVKQDGHNCYGCGQNNPFGLKMNFIEQDDLIISEWIPQAHFEGYRGVLHGGIQSCLIDEMAAWVVYVKCATSGVTGKMEVKYKAPVSTLNGRIIIKGSLVEHNHRLAKIKVELCESSGKVLTEGIVEYFLFSPEKAKTQMNYPGIEAFFE
jgi:acyl-coenzyme A thioesterase PaaI-like protein